MSFLQPGWLLLGALLPVMVLLYFKRKQFVEYRVSCMDFWEEALREQQGFRVSRIERYLPLALQLMAGLLLVLAAAGPVWVSLPAGERVVLALDCSLSMKALEGDASRFELAREEARRIIRGLPDGSAVTLALLSDGVREQVAGAAKKEALGALEKVECTSRPLDLAFALDYIKGCSSPVIAVTDKDLPPGLRAVRVGGELDNAGILRASYDYYRGGVYCTLKNYSRSSKKIVLELWSGSRKIDSSALELQAGEEGGRSFAVPGADGVLTLKLEGRDMLPEDDIYFVPAGDAGRKKVLLSGSDYFLENALAAMADVRVLKTLDGTAGDCRAVLVARGGNVPALPPGAGVWYLAPGGGSGAEKGGQRVQALVSGASPPALGLNFKDVYLERAVPLGDAEGLQRVIEAGGATVMAAGYRDGRRTVRSTIDFARTNLVLLPEFPVLVSNIVNWLAGDPAGDFPGNPPPALVKGGDSGLPSGKSQAAGTPLYRQPGSFFILLALALLAAEWEVYRRGL